ncbi:DUF1203 domain-containing protein [Aliamphritea ceti]|uniref:DUF1203 domain-containing protein n=1 Tax=Aliamphritea ceti TaxID=1524258 RepID=UPI0021C28005|nr:DUF1203 domain-containing protein [Aliamphritea ceti]
MKYRIIPLRRDFTDKVRNTLRDDQNQSVEITVANGGEPCRDVMRRALPGEQIILASYCPFSQPGPYKEYGPVFILAEQSDENFDTSKLPFPTETNASYLGETFVLKTYCKNERIIDAKLATPSNAEAVLAKLFSDNKVAFAIARYAAFGCYSLRLEKRRS